MPLLLIILSRWLHVISACIAIGGFFFLRFILPPSLRSLDEPQAKSVLLTVRRAFKLAIHTSILLLLLSGIFNSYLAFDKYNLDKPLLHPLWGTHILLALIAIALSLIVLSGKEPPKSYRKLLTLNVIVLLLAVAVASTVKWARERAVAEHSAPTSAPEKP